MNGQVIFYQGMHFIYLLPNGNLLSSLNLNIDNQDYKIEIFTLLGQRIIEVNNQKKIDFSNYKKGVYLLKINSETNTKVIKFLKN